MSARRRRGASAVEFALCLPFLLGLVGAVVDYGWLLFRQANVERSVREAARFGASVLVEDDPPTRASDHARRVLDAAGLQCKTVAACTVISTLGILDEVPVLTVSATVSHDPLVGLFPLPPHLIADATVALEDQ